LKGATSDLIMTKVYLLLLSCFMFCTLSASAGASAGFGYGLADQPEGISKIKRAVANGQTSARPFKKAIDLIDPLGSLTGRVVDDANGQPIDYVAVGVFRQADDTPVKNFMTENDGYFQFNDLPYGVYKVRLSYVGYTGQTIENIIITKEALSKNLGVIRLKSNSNALNEVTITDTKPAIQFNGDTITFNVSQSLMAVGSTASDILKNVPLVSVDIDGKPSIAGKRNSRIFIDGKPSDYTASTINDLLSILPSDAIDRIEVITNPDVRYSADGDGIINIVLKKGFKIGLNGSLAATASTLGNYNGNAYVAYRDEKLSLTSSYGYKTIHTNSNSDYQTNNYLANTSTISSYRNQFNTGENSSDGHNMRVGMDWDISKTQNIRLSGNFNTVGSNSMTAIDDHRLNTSMIEQELRLQNNRNNNDGYNYTLSGDYSVKLSEKNEKLKIGFSSYLNASDVMRELARQTINSTGTKPYLQMNDVHTRNKGLDLNLDYDRPISKLSSVAFGGQTTLHTNNNEQAVTGRNYVTGLDTLNRNLTNSFAFYENIYSLYASINIRTKSRWSFRVGGRGEYTNVHFDQSKPTDKKLEPYINVFPNVSINKFFKKRYNVGLSYSMRITRPRDYMLNPLVDNSDTANIFYGNPALKPAFTHQAELSFGVFGAKWSLSPRLSYSTVRRIIERIRTPVGNIGNTESTYMNLASSDSYTLNVFGNYRPTKKITANGGASVSRVSYNSLANTSRNRTGTTYRTNLGLAFQLPQGLAAEGNLTYARVASAQGNNSGSANVSFGARKNFFNNKFTVRLLAADPFTQRTIHELIEGINYTQQRNSTVNTRNFSITASYRFTKVGRNTVNKQKEDKDEPK
jgi:outer membrane receptor protein involved in Fe transport